MFGAKLFVHYWEVVPCLKGSFIGGSTVTTIVVINNLVLGECIKGGGARRRVININFHCELTSQQKSSDASYMESS